MKFQNPSCKFFLNGRTDKQTDKLKAICSPLFQSWGHKQCFSLQIVTENLSIRNSISYYKLSLKISVLETVFLIANCH